jgi:hypothetical protein
MTPQLRIALVIVILVFAVGSATPQGRGRKVGLPPVVHVPGVPVPGIPNHGIGTRQSCVQACNTFHHNEAQICRGTTGRDRASCQQSINQQHRVCVQSCQR